MGVTRNRGVTYARLEGKKFGIEVIDGVLCDKIYDGSHYDPKLRKRQYHFVYKDENGEIKSSEVMCYKDFRNTIKGYYYL